VLQLRAYARPEQAGAVAAHLGALGGVRHLVVGGRTSGGMTELTGEVDSLAADDVLEVLRTFDLAADDVTLWRAISVQPLGWRRRRGRPTQDTAVWSEIAGRAQDNARPRLNYVLYMVAAGVIAGVGVLTGSSILVVGAMAISPDLLPMASAAVGLVGKHPQQAVRALVTLAVGLAIVAGAAAISTSLLRLDGRITDDLDLAGSVLGPSLTSVGPGTVLVALAAGMAGMLAYETAGSAAVGVAISVTTIPAAAYLGDSLALSGYQDGLGSLGVLGTNVAGIVTAATLTLLVQRRRRAPRERDAE
jgi:uncharacterized hydrophobic protein (TIGR00271 family)